MYAHRFCNADHSHHSPRFLLAKLHMNTLQTKNNPGAVHDALDVLPAEVNDTYGMAMDRIAKQNPDDKALAGRVLSWVTYAQRPLSLKELRHAVSILPMNSGSLVLEQLLTDVCAGLVVIDVNQGIMRLVRK
jgi:hypothetical protein